MTIPPEHTEEFLNVALEATSEGIWIWQPKSEDAYFSPRYYQMLGYEPDELPSGYATWASLVHPDDLESAQTKVRDHIESGCGTYEVEFRMRAKSGEWIWVLGRGKVAERDVDGRPVLVVGSHVNIDKQKREGQAYRDHLEDMVRHRTRELEETSTLLEATFDAIPDVLGVQDNRHRIIRYNEAGYRYLGKEPQEVKGQRCFELIGRKGECERCATSECYRTKRPAALTRYEEAMDAWLDIRAYPVLDEDGNLVRVIEHLRDITAERRAEAENRELQNQLKQAQKMESLGTLAGGIAHDFNNLLMGIQGRASLLSLQMAESGAAIEHVEAIENYVRSAADLTQQLLGFARRGKVEVKPVDINELVSSSVSLFGRTRKGIEIHIDPHPGPLVANADRGQLDQVLLNIYINAWQAMADSGEIRIETRATEIDRVRGQMLQIEPGSYCEIRITDTGTGMDEATCQRVFDPFFTTKEKGRGTGLGLASAYGIVNSHGGTITVDSRPGRGSTFSVVLPLTDEGPESEARRRSESVGGMESILLIDDEQMILDVSSAMLEALGYRVSTALGGAAAFGFLDDTETDIDLAILDLIMPGMSGPQVFDHIQRTRPDLPVLVASGYDLDGQAEALIERGCRGFIQKPFDMAELSEQVRRILDEPTVR